MLAEALDLAGNGFSVQLSLFVDGSVKFIFFLDSLPVLFIVVANTFEGLLQSLLSFLVVVLPVDVSEGLVEIVIDGLGINVELFDLVSEGGLRLSMSSTL